MERKGGEGESEGESEGAPGEDGLREVDVLGEGHAGVVAAADGVGRGEHRATRLGRVKVRGEERVKWIKTFQKDYEGNGGEGSKESEHED